MVTRSSGGRPIPVSERESPSRQSMPVVPRSAASLRPSASMPGPGSTAITSATSSAGGSASAPVPVPRSSAR